MVNLGFDDARLRYDSSGVKTVNHDAAKMVGLPSFQGYLTSQESKPAAIESPPTLRNNDEVPTLISLQPRVSVRSKKKNLPFAYMLNMALYETPNSTVLVDLTVDSPRPMVDLTMDSPRPIKKTKPNRG